MHEKWGKIEIFHHVISLNEPQLKSLLTQVTEEANRKAKKKGKITKEERELEEEDEPAEGDDDNAPVKKSKSKKKQKTTSKSLPSTDNIIDSSIEISQPQTHEMNPEQTASALQIA